MSNKFKPTKPGWYWHIDDDYGPGPVELGWDGFINRQTGRELCVKSCIRYDQKLLGTRIDDLHGHWLPMAGHGECEWSLDPDGVYETSCGEEFSFEYGGRVVEDNNFLFCPFCGKPVREA